MGNNEGGYLRFCVTKSVAHCLLLSALTLSQLIADEQNKEPALNFMTSFSFWSLLHIARSSFTSSSQHYLSMSDFLEELEAKYFSETASDLLLHLCT